MESRGPSPCVPGTPAPPRGSGGPAADRAIVRVRSPGRRDAESAALRGMELVTPFGGIRFRSVDQQSTMGTFVGKTTVRDGHGALKDWTYEDGANYLPPQETVKAWRPDGG